MNPSALSLSDTPTISCIPCGAQWAKIAKKVHKPPLWVNVINFELNLHDASIWVPWSPSDTKKS